MKKLITLFALSAMFLFTTAQIKPLSLFDSIGSVTKANHFSMLPKDYKLHMKDGHSVTYSNNKDFITFSFRGSKLDYISIVNPLLATNIDKYNFVNEFGVPIYSTQKYYIVKTATKWATPKYIFKAK